MSDMELDMADTLKEIRERGEDDADTEIDAEVEGSEKQEPEGEPVQEPVAGQPDSEPAKADEGVEQEPAAEVHHDAGDPSLVNPPSTWNAENKARWNELPDWARQQVLKREQDSIKGYQNLKDSADFGQQIQQTIQPYMPTIRSKGIEPSQAVETMLNAYYTLETAPPPQKAQALLQTAQQYGCLNEVNALLSGQNRQNLVRYTPDQIQQIVDQRLAQERAEQERKAQQEQESKIEQEVAGFVNATNEDGSLKHPYYENVWGEMVGIIQSAKSNGNNLSLEEAYERAVWANPETRPLMEQQAQRQQEAKARASRAKKADQVNLGRRPSHEPAEPSQPTGSVEETMQDALERIKAASG